MDAEKTIRYSKDGLTVLWKPEKCIHSCVCWKGLIQVFDPLKKPWVNLDGAPAESIRNQVVACPSGALSLDQPHP